MQPRHEDPFRRPDPEAEGMPAVDEQPPGVEEDSAVEEEPLPADRALVSNDFTTTATGQRIPEPAWRRARREQPEEFEEQDRPAGRLVAPEEAGDDGEQLAEEAEDDVGGLTAEEAAVHHDEPG